MNLWRWIGAYAVLAIGSFFILLLMTLKRPGELLTARSIGARLLVILGALVVMAMIGLDLQRREFMLCGFCRAAVAAR